MAASFDLSVPADQARPDDLKAPQDQRSVDQAQVPDGGTGDLADMRHFGNLLLPPRN